ncbi:hypothetical protein ACQP1W_03530 [Spirillospora sp. CA-255316]
MGMQLPGELTGLLSMLGYDWPQADESKLFELGSNWMGFGGTLSGVIGDADGVAQMVTGANLSEDIQAFQSTWSAEESPVSVLRKSAGGVVAVGACFFLCAMLVLALKISVIVQLIILFVQIAQAIATAAVTFGASLLEIPIFKEIAGIIIGFLIDQVIGALLG